MYAIIERKEKQKSKIYFHPNSELDFLSIRRGFGIKEVGGRREGACMGRRRRRGGRGRTVLPEVQSYFETFCR